MNPAHVVAVRNTNIAMAKTNKAPQSLNQYIEQTILKQTTTREDVLSLCREARELQFLGVCVPPYFVEDAVKELTGSGVKVVSVLGFPLGYSSTMAKVEEARQVINKGADELDMVINLAAYKAGDINQVKDDIDSVAMTVHRNNKLLKVIIESGILGDEEITELCALCVEAGADMVKTSTGFADKGASVAQVKLMRSVLPAKIGIKASGGIREKAFAEELIAAGATRIGTSSGSKIMQP